MKYAVTDVSDIKSIKSIYLQGINGIYKPKPAELLFSYILILPFLSNLAGEIASSFSPLGVSVWNKCSNLTTLINLKNESKILNTEASVS